MLRRWIPGASRYSHAGWGDAECADHTEAGALGFRKRGWMRQCAASSEFPHEEAGAGMRARALAQPAPVLEPGDEAMRALEVVAHTELPGLVVHDGKRFIVVPASQVLRVALPQYVLDDPSLGRVWDEQSADSIALRLQGRTIADLIRILHLEPATPEPAVDADATIVEIAAVMAAARVALVAVVDRGDYLGVITVHDLVGRMIS